MGSIQDFLINHQSLHYRQQIQTMHYLNKLSIVSLLLLSSAVSLFGQGLFSGGNGSKDDPYQIATETDLRTLAKEVNEKFNTFAGQYLKQTADITFTSADPIQPIGGPILDGFDRPNEMCFQGTYDGDMHKIYNLNLYDDRQLIEGEELHMGVGFFGVLGEGATIKNVVIASGHIYGFSGVGAIVGQIKDDCTITRCKIGPDVRITSWANAGGIAGSSLGEGMKIIECVNYANIEVYGVGIHKTAGGMIASSANTTIEGCANFGDIWAKGGFAGGMIGFMPQSTEDFRYKYPELKSCMNAGDISSMEPHSGGLIGITGYNLSGPQGVIPHQLISNSYSYGQTLVTHSATYGPILAFYANRFPLSVSKTFYNKDRYVMKQRENNVDAETAFALGQAKSHAEILSPDFITTLNEGGVSTFEADKHKINGTMPILKWINDTYDPEIDKPNQYRTDIPYTKVKQRAGSFFNPNRSGDFIIYDMSRQMPNIQAKSLGCNLDKGWVGRVLPIQGGKSYRFFMSTSAFRRYLKEDGMYVDGRPDKPADHWLITPSFTVAGYIPWFHWVGASEDEEALSSYELYVVEGAEEPMPSEILKTKPIYTVDKEAALSQFKETINGEERYYVTLTAHKVDLSKYVGKVIRLAFRDRSVDQYNLFIGQMKMAQANANTMVDNGANCLINVSEQTLSATRPESLLTLYSISGQQLAQAQDQLVYRGQSGVYILVVTDATGYTERRKVVLY